MPGLNPSNLVGIGTASYNGYVFGPKMDTVSIDGMPKYDQAERTIVYWVWTITLMDWITATSGTVDSLIQTVRSQLLVPGGNFTFTNKGFGDLTINSGAKKDVCWGPKPKGFKYSLSGGNVTAKIIWTVEVAVPESCVSPAYQFKVMESNYKATWSVDISGYSHRTISGYLRIPQTRATVTTRTLNDNADAWRYKIVPTVPDGFRRVGSDFTISEDKCRLDYTIKDSEMNPSAPPPGVIEVSADHTVTMQQYAKVGMWAGVINATYELAKDVGKASAYFYFLNLLASRVAPASRPGQTLIGRSLSIRDMDIYGKKGAQCTFAYTFSCQLSQLLSVSGLWQPVPDTDYTQWRASLANSLFNTRASGFANMGFTNSEDVIVDLCVPNVNTMRAGVPQPNPGNQGGGTFFSCPFPDSSWIDYTNDMEMDVDNQVVELKSLPRSNLALLQQDSNVDLSSAGITGYPTPPSNAGRIINSTSGYTPPIRAGTLLSTPQQRAAPDLSIILVGRALRVCWPIPAPVLTQIGGVPCVQANKEGEHFFISGQADSWLGLPVNYAMWRLRWILPQMPGVELGTVQNPFLGY